MNRFLLLCGYEIWCPLVVFQSLIYVFVSFIFLPSASELFYKRTIETGFGLKAYIFRLGEKIPFKTLSMNEVPNKTGTARFHTTPKEDSYACVSNLHVEEDYSSRANFLLRTVSQLWLVTCSNHFMSV